MLAIKIVALVLGVMFTLFGYFIFFRKKYSLINGFEEAFKEGRKNEKYARRVGIVEFVLGVVLLTAGVVLVVLA